jgi:hypothetical protein
MKIRFATLPIALAATLLHVPAVAQTRVCVGGDLEHLSSAGRVACNASAQAVRNAADQLHAPDGWHFVVVCGEEGWKQYAAFSTRGEDAMSDAAADTDFEQHTTYLREDRLHTTQPRGFQRVVAHEVASILLKTDDEVAIQTQMAAWERNAFPQQASLK